MGRLFGYARVSTVEQAAADRTSMEEQERRIQGWAMMTGRHIDRMFRDPAVSGSVPLADRPHGGREMMAGLQAGDTIVGTKLDRLFRSASDALVTLETLKARGVGIVSLDCGNEPITDNGTSKLLFSFMAAIGEWERFRIAERMSDGRSGKRARGGHIGGLAPYGYRVKGKGRGAVLVEDTDEQAVVKLIRQRRSEGTSLRQIAAELTAANILNRRGCPFHPAQIERISRPCNASPNWAQLRSSDGVEVLR